MKQNLNLKQTQQLNLSPQLKHAIKLLQCSNLEFDLEVGRILAQNPLLELEENNHETIETPSSNNDNLEEAAQHSDEEYTDWEWSDTPSHQATFDDYYDPMLNVAAPVSLRASLLAQLAEYQLSQRDLAIITLLIEELDDQGYLSTSLEDIAENLPLDLMIDEEELAANLTLLQQFEPAGAGARNLQESLLIQIKTLEQNGVSMLAQFIIKDHFDCLGDGQFHKLKKILHLPDTKITEALNLISSLNPYPAFGLDTEQTHYISPDVLVKKHNGSWHAQVNAKNMPNIKLNQVYAQAVACSETKTELSGTLQEAQWLLKSIEQRFDTIQKVAEQIVDRQQAFFEKGELSMKPLTLKEIATELNIHESTVSRACTQKYLLCSKGLFELKYFFSQKVHHNSADSSDDISNMAIKARLKEIIANEDPNHPFSDNKLAELLESEQISIARRTVTKYREAMHIKSARERKIS